MPLPPGARGYEVGTQSPKEFGGLLLMHVQEVDGTDSVHLL